jgi:hypothetical protein
VARRSRQRSDCKRRKKRSADDREPSLSSKLAAIEQELEKKKHENKGKTMVPNAAEVIIFVSSLFDCGSLKCMSPSFEAKAHSSKTRKPRFVARICDHPDVV